MMLLVLTKGSLMFKLLLFAVSSLFGSVQLLLHQPVVLFMLMLLLDCLELSFICLMLPLHLCLLLMKLLLPLLMIMLSLVLNSMDFKLFLLSFMLHLHFPSLPFKLHLLDFLLMAIDFLLEFCFMVLLLDLSSMQLG